MTRLYFTFCLSQPGPAYFLAESRARHPGQGFGPCFDSLHKAQYVSSLSRRLAPQNKVWIYTLLLTYSLCVSPCRVSGSHRRTRLGSTFCHSPSGSACLLAESRARNEGQGLGPRFDYLHQAQHITSPSRGLAPQDKAWTHVLPFSTRLSVSPRRVAGSQRRTRLRSTL